MKTGKLNPINKLSIAFGDFLTTYPTVPLVDTPPNFSFPMDGNDLVGDCVVAGWDHFRQTVTGLLNTQKNFTQDQIWAFYKTQNPLFDPNSTTHGPGSPYDGGMSVQLFLEYLATNKYILGFAKIDHTNESQMRAAIYLGLGIVTGVQLDKIQMQQYETGTWENIPGAEPDGGHCIPLIGYRMTPDESSCVTWGKIIQCTQNFITKQMDEAWFVLMQEHVDHPSFRNHFDLEGFAAAVSQITDGKVVIPITATLPMVTLHRTILSTETFGNLSTDGFTCHTLELGWHNNQHLISCIPPGTYLCQWKPFHTTHHYELQNVPGRTGIFIHEGNYAGKKTDTDGCILLGSNFVDINHDNVIDISGSTKTVAAFEKFMDKRDFLLVIK